MPFPCIKIEKDATITTNVTIIPKKRETLCLVVVHSVLFLLTLSNISVDTRCIVDVAHMKPKIIPPKSAEWM